MSPDHDGRWQVELPAAGTDPYLAATLFLLDHDHGALIVSPDLDGGWSDPAVHGSLHSRTLFEAVPVIDPAFPGPVARRQGLGLVLVEPTPRTLEMLDWRAFPTAPGVMLLPSAANSERRAWQAAWLWAQRRGAPEVPRRSGTLDPRAVDPEHVLTDEEVWALAVRAGARNAAALRGDPSPGVGAGSGRILRLVRWRA